jgi:hypothetical protein
LIGCALEGGGQGSQGMSIIIIIMMKKDYDDKSARSLEGLWPVVNDVA